MYYKDKLCGIYNNIYRSRAEIKEDIKAISERIAEVNEMLNIRELISDIFNEENHSDIIKRAENITELLRYAEQALEELRNLTERLDELKAELLADGSTCAFYVGGDIR